jgi:hypothetical protein
MAGGFIQIPRFERNWSYVLGKPASGVTEFTLCNIEDGRRSGARHLGRKRIISQKYDKSMSNKAPNDELHVVCQLRCTQYVGKTPTKRWNQALICNCALTSEGEKKPEREAPVLSL